MVISQKLIKKLEEKCIPQISSFEQDLEKCWGIPIEVEVKTTKTGKEYMVITLTDDTFSFTTVKCWGINTKKDKIFLHHPYIIKPQKSEQWGLSTNGGLSKWNLLI